MFFTGETSEHYLVYQRLFYIKFTWAVRGVIGLFH